MLFANLQKDHRGDSGFWRRIYIGLLLICEASPDARLALAAKAAGSGQCLGQTP
jgi:hypothetical protein